MTITTDFHGALSLTEPTLIAGKYCAVGVDEAQQHFHATWEVDQFGRTDWDNPKLARIGVQISYTRSIIGWYNVTIASTGDVYNVEPRVFLATTGVHERARTGCTALTDIQLATLLTAPFTRLITPQDVAVAV
ncbi:hypothetical protein [Sporosarcina sp. A2]|uniref:hypothetical protein n=1 Tax=Sporosarcina sp. A2 TaxID=3393449 RepID=UPI003D79F5CF